MKKQTISEIKQFQKIAGLLKETWHPDDPASVDVDDIEDKDPDDYDDISEDDSEAYSESGNTDAMGGINEIGGGFKFKVGDVVNSKVNKGNKLVILMAFPNLEAATKYDERDKPDFWESAIVRGEIAPVSKDVANKPWYLAWTREVKGEDLVMCDPEEFLSK